MGVALPSGLAGAVASPFSSDAAGESRCASVAGVASLCVWVAVRQLPDGVRASPWGEGEGLPYASVAASHDGSAPASA